MFLFFVNNSYRMLRFESFVFTCLTYKNVQRFQNRTVHKFYGLKVSQMSKVPASSHECPHVGKIKNLRGQKFKGDANMVRILNEATWVVTALFNNMRTLKLKG